MKRTLAALGVLAALAAAGCGSTASHAAPAATTAPATTAPAQSAANACHDFDTWWLGTSQGTTPGANLALLSKAVQEAPSGQLYQDISAMQQAVDEGLPSTTLTTQAYQVVVNDCSSINPNGGASS